MKGETTNENCRGCRLIRLCKNLGVGNERPPPTILRNFGTVIAMVMEVKTMGGCWGAMGHDPWGLTSTVIGRSPWGGKGFHGTRGMWRSKCPWQPLPVVAPHNMRYCPSQGGRPLRTYP